MAAQLILQKLSSILEAELTRAPNILKDTESARSNIHGAESRATSLKLDSYFKKKNSEVGSMGNRP